MYFYTQNHETMYRRVSIPRSRKSLHCGKKNIGGRRKRTLNVNPCNMKSEDYFFKSGILKQSHNHEDKLKK